MPQKASSKGIRVLRRICWMPSSAYTSHIVAKAQRMKLMHTHRTKTTSPTCALPRNGDLLPDTGRVSFMNCPIISTENPACPQGPSGMKEETIRVTTGSNQTDVIFWWECSCFVILKEA